MAAGSIIFLLSYFYVTTRQTSRPVHTNNNIQLIKTVTTPSYQGANELPFATLTERDFLIKKIRDRPSSSCSSGTEDKSIEEEKKSIESKGFQKGLMKFIEDE